jgi:hypothetical protein
MTLGHIIGLILIAFVFIGMLIAAIKLLGWVEGTLTFIGAFVLAAIILIASALIKDLPPLYIIQSVFSRWF